VGIHTTKQCLLLMLLRRMVGLRVGPIIFLRVLQQLLLLLLLVVVLVLVVVKVGCCAVSATLCWLAHGVHFQGAAVWAVQA
jgi:hypothetical protein